MDFWVVLPVHSASEDSSRESETHSSSGQLLTAQQSEDEHNKDEESAEERLFKEQHEVQSDSGTGKYPWFSFVDSSSTAEFLNVLIDELGKTTSKAALQPKGSMAAIFLAAKTTNEYRLVEHISKTAHLTDPPRRGLDVKSEKIALAALFLAAKATNEHRHLEHIIKTALALMVPSQREVDVKSEKISLAALFLAAKVTNEYRLTEYVIKTALFMDPPRLELDVKSRFYNNLKKEIVSLERLLLQVLGFQVDVELPHPHVIKMCQLFKKISMAAIFLAAKTTNEYRLVEHIIKTAHYLMDPSQPTIDVKSEHYGYNHVLAPQASDGGLCLCQLGSLVGTDTGPRFSKLETRGSSAWIHL
ncbi:unnamed protein product [Larinioides sclopetarius]|uniref:Cyclin N-terminal domain-containing protein n=1 Tax=Larinioides sclopetarius TaxID=280406 RepID=A0AAV2B3F3_9ARAC